MLKINCENPTCHNKVTCAETALTKFRLIFCSQECANAYHTMTGEINIQAKGIEITKWK